MSMYMAKPAAAYAVQKAQLWGVHPKGQLTSKILEVFPAHEPALTGPTVCLEVQPVGKLSYPSVRARSFSGSLADILAFSGWN